MEYLGKIRLEKKFPIMCIHVSKYEHGNNFKICLIQRLL